MCHDLVIDGDFNRHLMKSHPCGEIILLHLEYEYISCIFFSRHSFWQPPHHFYIILAAWIYLQLTVQVTMADDVLDCNWGEIFQVGNKHVGTVGWSDCVVIFCSSLVYIHTGTQGVTSSSSPRWYFFGQIQAFGLLILWPQPEQQFILKYSRKNDSQLLCSVIPQSVNDSKESLKTVTAKI